jgi:hypothetical protein
MNILMLDLYHDPLTTEEVTIRFRKTDAGQSSEMTQ